MESKIKDYLDLTKQSLSTFHNIGQMARYRAQNNQEKASKYAFLATLGILGLLAIGLSSLYNKKISE